MVNLGTKPIRIFLLLLIAVGLVSCSVVGNITDETAPGSTVKFDKATGSEFVSGSNQYEHTLLRDYKINSSVGGMIKEIQSTTPRGYKVYSSVQGALLFTQENP